MSVRALATLGLVGTALLGVGPTASSQSIDDRVAEVDEGEVRMSFAAKPGVCGDGEGTISTDDGRGWRVRRGDDDWEQTCEHGPVRVVLTVRDNEVTRVRTYVAGSWRSPSRATVDLGTVSAPQASDYLLTLARRSANDAGEEAILPAMLADSSTVWPDLLDMAKDESLRHDTRKSAVFWLSQAASEAATAGLEEIVDDEDEDREIRKTAVFALSQRPKDEGVPALIQVARNSQDAAIRKQALFWLGQSEDPRAIALFEEILTRR
ncbi:MAG: hypothetical protein AMS21_12245 [Gemmatimonas sp. SG8_38_2]|nr:MAG: hypothetical protein AMS21_12245 [Gemmatimonas sp. SG8_38_2]